MAVSTIGALELDADGMDAEATLLGGQSFSWRKTAGGGFAGVAGQRAVELIIKDGLMTIRNLDGREQTAEDEAFWRHYLALDTDYQALQAALCRSASLAECVAAAPGLRVLRQPFFETLLAFIISQNNHIPRITGIVGRLRSGFGPHIAAGEHAFPAAEALAVLQPEDLAPLRAGFRAKYLIDAAIQVANGRVSEAELQAAPTAEARRLLMQIKGVGPKVADCVLLFALQRDEVAPMDVWMKKAMAQCFGGELPACAAGVQGIAQQYVFEWARVNLPRGNG